MSTAHAMSRGNKHLVSASFAVDPRDSTARGQQPELCIRTRQTPAAEPIGLGMQANLRLAGIVAGVVTRNLDHALLFPATTPPSARERARRILAILTYCYAAGIYGSSEIADLIGRNAAKAAPWDQGVPDMHGLRGFRRYHHDLLRECLETVLAEWWTESSTPAIQPSLAGPESDPASTGTSHPTDRSYGAAREAAWRIRLAVTLDSAALDE